METGQDERVGTCWECGYSLRGLPTPRCPECGRAFDPADAKTMNMGIEVGGVKRWIMRPPGWPLHVLTAIAVLVSLWACVIPTRPGAFADVLGDLLVLHRVRYFDELEFSLRNPLGRFLVGVSLWAIIVCIWMGRRVARGITVKRLSKQKAAPFAYWRRWLITPVIFGLTVLACRTYFPTYAGFWVSKPWLNRAVDDAKAAPERFLSPRAIGVFDQYPDMSKLKVSGKNWSAIWTEEGGTVVHIARNAYLAYREDGEPKPGKEGQKYKRLSTHWFLFEPDPSKY